MTGFIDCEFSGNENNSEIILIGDGSTQYGVYNFFMWNVSFNGNIANNEILHVQGEEGHSGINWLKDCEFKNNGDTGKLIFLTCEKPPLFACGLTFSHNSCDELVDTVMNNALNDPVLEFRNCLFYGNTGNIESGNSGSSLFENCTFHDNTGNITGNGNASVRLHNSIFRDNTSSIQQTGGGQIVIEYTNIDIAFQGTSLDNIDEDPLFIDPANGDYRVVSGSPVIDAGDPASFFGLEPVPNGSRIDMGAYGNTPDAGPAGIANERPGDVNDDKNINLLDCIIVLKICAGIDPSSTIRIEADIDNDKKIGMEEVLYILRKIANL